MSLIDCGSIMNGLLMTRGRQEIFMCWLLCYVSKFADSRMKVPRYRPSRTSSDLFFLSVFSSSEVLAKIASIQRLVTAACWSRKKREETVIRQLALCQK